MSPKPEPEEKINFESLKTRINDEIPKTVIAEFVSEGDIRCPRCSELLTLKPIIAAAGARSRQTMVETKAAEPLPAMPALVDCRLCKMRGGRTTIHIQH